MSQDLWRGRMTQPLNKKIANFLSSLKEDISIIETDIDVAETHTIMLHKQGYIDKKSIKEILKRLEKQRQRKELPPPTSIFHDIHPIIEKEVIESEPKIAGAYNIHLGKSRNDQVVADMRIKLREDLIIIISKLLKLIEIILNRAKKDDQVIMPAYTHLLPAQPIFFSYYLLCYVELLCRNTDNLFFLYKKLNLNPLGAGPIGATSINIDREYTSKLLGFDGIIENSIDAVSNRDFVLEYAYYTAIIANSLSRIIEDFMLWQSFEYNMISLPDNLTDTSSSMPQKKNPCPLELSRAKVIYIVNLSNTISNILLRLPTGYNRDMQEIKRLAFEIKDNLVEIIEIMELIISNVELNIQRMKEIIQNSNIVAIDLAEYLINYMPYREANYIVGRLIKDGINLNKVEPKNINLTNLTNTNNIVNKINAIAKELNKNKEVQIAVEEIEQVITPEISVNKRIKNISWLIKNKKMQLTDKKEQLKKIEAKLTTARTLLKETVANYIKND